MPFNGLGTFTRLYNFVQESKNPATNFIRADEVDNEFNGVAAGLSN